MGPITTATTIDAPREEVFAFLADLANRPVFTDHFTSDFRLTREDSRGVGAGARFRLDVPLNPQWVESVVTAVEAPVRIAERGRGGRGGRIPVAIGFELAEEAAGMTRVTALFWSETSHPLDRLKEAFGAAAWHRRQWRRALRRLGEQIESGRAAEGRVVVAGEDAVPTGVR